MAENKMNMADLISQLSLKKHYPQNKAELYVRKMFNLIKLSLENNEYIKIKGFGTFKFIIVSSRQSVDVNTGQKIEISEHKRLIFTPDTNFKARINRPFEKFESIILEDDIDTTNLAETEEIPNIEETPFTSETKESATKERQDNLTSETEVHTIYLNDEEKEVVEDKTENLEISKVSELLETSEVPEITQNEKNNENNKSEYLEEEEEEQGHSYKWLKVTGSLIGILLLMVGSYYAGYLHLWELPSFTETPTQSSTYTKADTVKTGVIQSLPADTLKAEENKTSEPTPEELSKGYDQIEGGEYLIVGTQDEIEFKEGYTLLKIARKTYGDMKLWPYIVLHNHIKNPDVIALGMKLKLPKLIPVHAETENKAKE